MNRSYLLLILCSAAVLLLLLLVFGFARALILRRRRKRQAAQAWRVPMPQVECGDIEAIRREADEAHQRQLRLQEAEARRQLEAEWRHDGQIVLERKKPPEDTP